MVRVLTPWPVVGERSQTLCGFLDRGLIAPGKKDDLNVIDLDALKLLPPDKAFDLSSGTRRLR